MFKNGPGVSIHVLVPCSHSFSKMRPCGLIGRPSRIHGAYLDCFDAASRYLLAYASAWGRTRTAGAASRSILVTAEDLSASHPTAPVYLSSYAPTENSHNTGNPL